MVSYARSGIDHGSEWRRIPIAIRRWPMAKSEIPKIETEYLMAINPTFKLEEMGRTPYGKRRIVHSATGDFKGQGKLKGLKGTIETAFGWTLIRDHDRVWEINVRMVLRPVGDSSKANLIYASWMGLRHG